ncbi:MAG: arginine--tRNA ligase [Candidatus Altiarchaeota archaeon]
MDKAKKEICSLIKGVSGVTLSFEDITDSPVSDYASNVCFRLAKKEGKNPKDIAQELSIKIKKNIEKSKLIDGVKADGGYLNFSLNYGSLLSDFLTEIKTKKEKFGRGEKKDEKIVLEHSSVNPSGPIHVGRIRNTLIGDSLRRILVFFGYDVQTRYYVNNVGKQIAIIAAGKKQKIPTQKEILQPYEKYKSKKDFEILATYVSSNEAFEKDEQFQKKVQTLLQSAESGNKEDLQLLKDNASSCLSGQKEVFDQLDVQFDIFDFESKYLEDGSVKEIINKLKNSKYAVESNGGFGLDLTEFGLAKRSGATMLVRADGTSIYTIRDLAYHLDKAKAGDQLINVLGEDHKFQFKELTTILRNLLGFTKPLQAVHFSFVNFEGTKLSTRKGNIAPVDVLLDEAKQKAKEEIKTKNRLHRTRTRHWLRRCKIPYPQDYTKQKHKLPLGRSIKLRWRCRTLYPVHARPVLHVTFEIKKRNKRDISRRTERGHGRPGTRTPEDIGVLSSHSTKSSNRAKTRFYCIIPL